MEVDVTRLELDLMEYAHTQRALLERRIKTHGLAGALAHFDVRDTVADLRAILDGHPVPARMAV